MSFDLAASPKEVLEAFQKATTTFNLCPNRVWAVARDDLPKLIPAAKEIRCLDDHTQCTVDLCEYSQRDFTAVQQRHECRNEKECETMSFKEQTLVKAAMYGKSTVWKRYGREMLAAHRPYMAISHVWSDGTGTGSWPAGVVNSCLYFFFDSMAIRLGCEGIWWDTVSIPREKAARTIAIRGIQSSYQAARLTLVHDCFLRNSLWVDAEAACFTILMSPWFSRGWTALELANSQKVKVLFKGPHGLLVKDLDEEILAKDEHASEAHKRATDLIMSLRRGVKTLDDLLVVLGARCTSWPKDMAIISGLLVGVDISPQGETQDVLQQDIYKRILTKIGRLSAGHLFHNSATIYKGLSWCPINLFSMPISGKHPSLTVEDDLDLMGTWDIIPISNTLEQNCIWTGTHLLLKLQLQLALQDVDKCVLLTECGTQTVGRALLVKLKRKEEVGEGLCFQYVGALHFHPGLSKKDYVNIEARIIGDASRYMVDQQANAWEYIKKRESSERHPPRVPKTKAPQEIKDKTIIDLWPNGHQTIHEPGTGRTALHYAILRNDRTSFQELLKISNIKTRDELGQLPLHLVADRGHVEMLYDFLSELFSRCGSDIPRRTAILNAPRRNGETTLHLAVFACSEIIVDTLLKNGVDPDLMDNNGTTSLHIAVRDENESITKRLLEARADPNLTNYGGSTALHIAVVNRNESLIERLLEARADPNLADNSGSTALHLAVRYRNEPNIGRLLEAGADPNLMSKQGNTALHEAIGCMFKPAIMRLLSDYRCNVNMAKVNTLTPLYWAVHYGDEQLVRLLVENGADVNKACGPKKEIPLWHAITRDKSAMVEFFISNGTNPNTKGKDRMSLLHLAVEKGDGKTALLLLNKGANVNAKDKSSLTPLHYAARQGSASLVELLLSNGASVKAKGSRGSTPLDFARRRKCDEVANLLRGRR